LTVKLITNSSIKIDANQLLVGSGIPLRNRAVNHSLRRTQTTIICGSEKSQSTDESQSTYSTTSSTTKNKLLEDQFLRQSLQEVNP